jgi:hypothetical protein
MKDLLMDGTQCQKRVLSPLLFPFTQKKRGHQPPPHPVDLRGVYLLKKKESTSQPPKRIGGFTRGLSSFKKRAPIYHQKNRWIYVDLSSKTKREHHATTNFSVDLRGFILFKQREHQSTTKKRWIYVVLTSFSFPSKFKARVDSSRVSPTTRGDKLADQGSALMDIVIRTVMC